MHYQGAWKMAQTAKCVLYKCTGLSLDLQHPHKKKKKPAMVLHTHNPSAEETEMGGSQWLADHKSS